MERLTVNKSKDDMNMVEMAHNCCFVKDGKAMYRDYDTIIDTREFARNLIRARNLISSDDEVFTNDTAFDEFMSECLLFSPFDDGELIALFYRNLWAQADLYERLKHYEDFQEQLEKTYGDCDGLLEIVVDGLVKHDGVDIENPIKSRLLTDDCADKWLKWKNADEQGRLLELPCSVGDTVYAYCGEFGILPYEVDCIVIDENFTYQCSSYSEPIGDCPSECLDEIEPDLSDFDKTVFLTQEEAEKALEGKAE